MATPHVAGAWALLKQAIPGASVATLLSALRCAGEAMVYSICDSFTTGIPRIRIDKALLLLLPNFTLTIQRNNAAWGTTTPTPGVHTLSPQRQYHGHGDSGDLCAI